MWGGLGWVAIDGRGVPCQYLCLYQRFTLGVVTDNSSKESRYCGVMILDPWISLGRQRPVGDGRPSSSLTADAAVSNRPMWSLPNW